MRLLLDTHIWLRALDWPEKLSRKVKHHIQDQRSELYLSPISLWETQQLIRKGKVKIHQGLSRWLNDALLQLPVIEAPVNFAVAEEASRIDLPQNDFGDLFLAATASVFDLTLVTADRQLIECSWLKTLADE